MGQGVHVWVHANPDQTSGPHSTRNLLASQPRGITSCISFPFLTNDEGCRMLLRLPCGICSEHIVPETYAAWHTRRAAGPPVQRHPRLGPRIIRPGRSLSPAASVSGRRIPPDQGSHQYGDHRCQRLVPDLPVEGTRREGRCTSLRLRPSLTWIPTLRWPVGDELVHCAFRGQRVAVVLA